MTISGTRNAQLQEAVLAALAAADHARNVLRKEASQKECSPNLLSLADRLEPRLAKYDVFGEADELHIRVAGEGLEALARDEIRLEYFPDEHCVSGGFEVATTSGRGESLLRACHALTGLAEMLAIVRRQITAQKLTSGSSFAAPCSMAATPSISKASKLPDQASRP